MSDNKSKRYCFTINNFITKGILPEDLLAGASGGCTYIVFQHEVGDNGTPHLQGYIEFGKRQRFSSVKKMIGGNCHLEAAKGKPEQNRTYCTKAGRIGGPWEHGDISQVSQGKRTDMDQIAEMVADGETLRDIAVSYPGQYMRYGKGIREYKSLVNPVPVRTVKPHVTVYWGLAGSGKTTKVISEVNRLGLGEVYYPTYREQGKCYSWTNYNNEPVVVFEDFYGQMPYSSMLNLLDRTPQTVSGLYCELVFNSPFIYFTSNKKPSTWYNLAAIKQVSTLALMRRFDIIEYFGTVVCPKALAILNGEVEEEKDEEEQKYFDPLAAVGRQFAEVVPFMFRNSIVNSNLIVLD